MEYKTRSEMNPAFMWDMSHIFPDRAAWDSAYENAQSLVAEGYISYDEYPAEAFRFNLKKDEYPSVSEGVADVYLFVGDDGLLAEWWIVDLQEFTQ